MNCPNFYIFCRRVFSLPRDFSGRRRTIHAHVADLHLVGDAAKGDDGSVLKFKRRDDAQLLHRPRQVADDEAAPGAPEHSLSGNAQTARRRLAMTRQAVLKPSSLKIAQPFMAGLNVINIKSPAGTKEL